jgi:hypothetical protein
MIVLMVDVEDGCGEARGDMGRKDLFEKHKMEKTEKKLRGDEVGREFGAPSSNNQRFSIATPPADRRLCPGRFPRLGGVRATPPVVASILKRSGERRTSDARC